MAYYRAFESLILRLHLSALGLVLEPYLKRIHLPLWIARFVILTGIVACVYAALAIFVFTIVFFGAGWLWLRPIMMKNQMQDKLGKLDV